MIACIILGLLCQEPGAAAVPPPSLPEDARALLQAMAGARAVDLEFHGRVHMTGSDAIELRGEFHAAGPKSGWLQVTFGPPDGDTAANRLEIVGDGERLVFLDRTEKTWMPAFDDFGKLFSMAPVLPLALWAGITEPDHLQGRWVEGEPANAVLRILEVRSVPGTPVEYLWFGADGRLLAARMTLGDDEEGQAEFHFYFRRAEFLAEADAADYRREPPEGFSLFDPEVAEGGVLPDFEEDLLSVGAMAPEVTLQDMEDREFSLASLRGKTVLLNFWFYH